MKACRGLGLLLTFAAIASAQSNQYTELRRDVIEDRLRQYADRNPVREATLKRLFEEAGCGGERLQEQPVPHAASPNVICTLPGIGNGVILVGAHFDHVRDGDGVVDNWSGASLLPSLYQSLSARPRQHTYVFISFTDEEKGFVGSDFYAKRLTNGEVSRIQGMVDIDTLGLGPTEIWVSNSDPGLVGQMFEVASAMKLPVQSMNVDKYGNSDGRSFSRREIPIITLHSVTPETFGILHTRKDNLAAVKLDDYYDSYKLIAAYLAALDSALTKRRGS
jgi:aminopeptidase-like protein